MSLKTLISLFIVLLLIILAELVFYFFLLKENARYLTFSETTTDIVNFFDKFEDKSSVVLNITAEYEGYVRNVVTDKNRNKISTFSIVDDKGAVITTYQSENSMKFWISGQDGRLEQVDINHIKEGQRVHAKDTLDLVTHEKFIGFRLYD